MSDVFLPIVPNWANGVQETYGFLTSVFVSRDGSEQRRSQRILPRRSLAIAALLDGDRLSSFSAAVNRALDGVMVTADFCAEAALTVGTLAAGGQLLEVRSKPSWLFGGAEVAIITGRRAVRAQVDFTSGTLVTLLSPVRDAIGAAAKIYPLIPVELGQATNLSMHTNLIATTAVTVDVIPGTAVREPADLPVEGDAPLSGVATAAMFRGRYVLLLRPNYLRSPEIAFASQHQRVDYGRGVVKTYAPVSMLSRTFTAEYMGKTRNRVLGLLDIFLRAKGRGGEVLVPTWGNDLPEVLSTGVNRVTVAGTEIYDSFNEDPAHKTVLIRRRDGALIPAQIISMSTQDGDTRVFFDEDLPAGTTPEQIKSICWLMVCRFAQDDLTVNWVTDTVANLSLSFVALVNQPVEDIFSNWILATGYWRDSGEWVDSETWRDS